MIYFKRYVDWKKFSEISENPENYADEMKKERDEVDELMAMYDSGVFEMCQSMVGYMGNPDDAREMYIISVHHVVMDEPKVDVYEFFMANHRDYGKTCGSTAMFFPKYTFIKSLLRLDQVEFLERVLQLQSSK